MQNLVLVTGTTDDYGLCKLRELLLPYFREVGVQRALGVLRTSALLVETPYVIQLDAMSTLTVVHQDTTTQDWQFCLQVVAENHERRVRLPQSFLKPGVDVNLKNVQVLEPGLNAMVAVSS